VTGAVVVVVGALVLVVELVGGLAGTVTLSSSLPLVSSTIRPPITRAPAKIPPMIHHHFVVSVPAPEGRVGSRGLDPVGSVIAALYCITRPGNAATRASA
jgi:hypothetical protein